MARRTVGGPVVRALAAWRRTLFGLLLVYLLLPVVIVLPMSFNSSAYLSFPPSTLSTRWYARYLTDGRWVEATVLSLKIGVATALLATILGTPAAIALGIGRSAIARVFEMVCLTPLVFPTIVFAIASYVVLTQWGLSGSAWGIWLAHTVLAIPFVVANVTASVRVLDVDICRAAESLGANPWRTLRDVVVPNIKYGMLAGCLMAFVTSFDEVVVALYLSSTTTVTLPKLMFDGIMFEINPVVAAVSSVFISLNILVFAAVAMLKQKERGVSSPLTASSEMAAGRGAPR